jgi:two-component system NtrC family response regulator
VVQDMNFTHEETSGEQGARLFRAIRQLDPDMPVLLMTTWTSLETAVALIKEGAADYMAKPWDDQKLLRTVENLVNLRALKQENLRLRSRESRARRALAAKHDLCDVLYASPQMHQAVSLAIAVAPSDAAILITGPNGSGKEKMAEIIVANSRRRDKPFVKVNVGALPETLFEAEIFGAEAGAYSGATKQRIGRFEAADGGTLFLDELGTLPLPAQAKLLRVLQTGEFERLGSSHTRTANVRIISATNTDLGRAIAAGTFREDLFFRLNVVEIYVPPLSDRPDDVLLLANHFLTTIAAQPGTPEEKSALTFGEEATTALVNHDWPGNVRELQNRVQRAVLIAAGQTVTPADLGLTDTAAPPRAARSVDSAVAVAVAVAAAATATASVPSSGTPSAESSSPARASIEEALIRNGGVVAKAAAEMGLSRQALYRRMERLGITIERRLR